MTKPILSNQDRAQLPTAAPSPTICLVKPQMGENIGAAARAMANFGLDELTIVNPRDGWPNEKATALAVGAHWIFDNVKLCDTTSEAIADKNLVFATSGTPRQIDKPLISPSQAIEIINQEMKNSKKPIVLFGNERFGLDQIDIVSADYIVTYPTDFKFPSLNLAQSIAIFCYEWATRDGDKLPDGWHIHNHEPADKKYFDSFFHYLVKELDELGFFWPLDRRDNMIETMKSALSRGKFADSEINMLRGAVRVILEGPRRRFDELMRNQQRDKLRAEFINAAVNGTAFYGAKISTKAELKEIVIENKTAAIIYYDDNLQYLKVSISK